ncbi:hypothetical protein ISN44_As07g010020 [Arabidopsis suecica]|uniref:DUF8039 domain-containing protein n=1 Tax=Arabidopsis suecica TaxID=45249 RepID=A0A8T2BRP8_ARASU|nr:hypothetical protein ISN44_As07g010020 [Arabidopsis suecica]
MGRPKKKGGKQSRKKKDTTKDDEPEYIGTVEPEIHEEDQQTRRLPAEVTDKDGVQDELDGEVELFEDQQPKRKKHRGPTKMKNIAKDPTVREKVDYTLMGDPYGLGSVKLSSYIGTLVTFLLQCISFDGKFFAGKAVSDKYKEWRSKQIPHTTEDMKIESGDPSEVTRLKMKAVELVGTDAPTTTTSSEEDHLSKLLGPDNPGRLRAMGRGMSNTKLACFQVKTKCMTEMQEKQVKLLKKVNELQEELSKMKNQIIAWPASKCVLLDKELQIEDIAPLGLRVNSLNKCKLLDLSNDDVIVAEGRWQTQEEIALVNGLPLGPKSVKVFVDSVLQLETFIWRSTIDMIYLENCLMAFVSWPVNKVSFENPSAGQHSASTDIPSGSKSVVGTHSAETSAKAASTASKSSG